MTSLPHRHLIIKVLNIYLLMLMLYPLPYIHTPHTTPHTHHTTTHTTLHPTHTPHYTYIHYNSYKCMQYNKYIESLERNRNIYAYYKSLGTVSENQTPPPHYFLPRCLGRTGFPGQSLILQEEREMLQWQPY